MKFDENIKKIQDTIPNDVHLIAVSKTRSIEDIQDVYDYGIRDFGENKVQELVKKQELLNDDIRWHLIGHLQTNKVKYIVGKVHLIHSIDSIHLVKKLQDEYEKKGLICNGLIQINVGREEQKYGILEEELHSLINYVEICSNVKIHGIMTIIPKGNDDENKKYFKKCFEIWSSLKNSQYKNINMEYLSMGMTHDYQNAVLCGANMIRIGEGIFGKREYDIK